MLVHFGVDLLQAEWLSSVVCIGTFDGVHHGHQSLINRSVEMARQAELPSVLVTFDRHPAATLAPDRKPPAIGTLEQNVRLFRSFGVSACVILPFDLALSQLSAADFLAQILKGKLHAGQLVVGYDFALGHGRQGTVEWLSERIPTEIMPAVEIEGVRVSSTEIRKAIMAGEVGIANRLLSRPFAMTGVVVAGQKMGRQLGYPTINLARSTDQVVPQDGVYAGECETSFGSYRAAISIGNRPAVGGTTRTIEAYLLDYPGKALYSETVQLQFHQRIRDEADFADLEALKHQISNDVQRVASMNF